MSANTELNKDFLVSIICRTMGRPHLAKALSSLAEQTHHNLEVLLVNASGTNLTSYIKIEPALNIREIEGVGKLSRAAAANAGLEAASGPYLMFLDDDDWIAPEHIAVLLNVLLNKPRVSAVYSCTQKTREDGSLTEEVFQQPYDSALLLRDNFMPIHSVLFKRELVDLGCRFDTSLKIYEDWDFWLQLSKHTDFEFVNTISAFYREGGDSQTDQKPISVRYQADHILGAARAKLFDKWLQKWSGSDLNRLLGSMDQGEYIRSQGEQIRSLEGEIKQRDDLLHAEHKSNLELQQHVRDLLNEQKEIKELVTDVHLLNKDLKTHNDLLKEYILLLKSSLSWRITKPLRWVMAWLRGSVNESGEDGTTNFKA